MTKYPNTLRDYTLISDGHRYWEYTNGIVPLYLNTVLVNKFGRKAATIMGYIYNCLHKTDYDGVKYKDDKGIEYVEITRTELSQKIGCTSRTIFTNLNLLKNYNALNIKTFESSNRKHVSYFLISIDYEKLEEITSIVAKKLFVMEG